MGDDRSEFYPIGRPFCCVEECRVNIPRPKTPKDAHTRDDGFDLLSPFLVPYYSNKRMDEVAEEIWRKYIPEALVNPGKHYAAQLAAWMGLTIQYYPVYEHKGVDSIIFFAEDDLTIGADRIERDEDGNKAHMHVVPFFSSNVSPN